MSTVLKRLTILIVVSTRIAEALTHLSQPVIRWKTQLGDGTIASAGLKRKNAVVLSNDGSELYATLDDGSLAILSTTTGALVTTYVPSPIEQRWTVSNIGSGASVSSQSGDIVYAVQDSPPPFRWNGTFWYQYEGWFASGIYNNWELTKLNPAFYPPSVELSRVISLDYRGQQRWMHSLNGFIVGTPVYGNRVQADGSKLVYVLHNVNNTGQITILMENSNGTSVQVLYNEVSKGGLPFSPMTMISSHLGDDVLFWSSTMNEEPGYDPRGRFYRVIVRPSLQILSSNGRHEFVGTATRPLLNGNGTSIWVAGTYARLYKLSWQADTAMWKGIASSEVDWKFQMDPSLRNETMPVMASPILSSDDRFLFIPSTTTAFYCIDAQSGEEVWKLKHPKRSIYMTEAKLSPDNTILYSILFMDGTVIAQNALTGSIIWEISCESLSGVGNCQDSVEAEFALSPDGTQLYFGDFKGNIVSLTVATEPLHHTVSPSTLLKKQPTSQTMSESPYPTITHAPGGSTFIKVASSKQNKNLTSQPKPTGGNSFGMSASGSFGSSVLPVLPPAIPKMPLVSPAKKPLVVGQSPPENLILKPSVNSPSQPLVNNTSSSAGSLQPVSPAMIPKMPLVNATDKSVDPSPSEAGNLVLKPSINSLQPLANPTKSSGSRLQPLSPPIIPPIPVDQLRRPVLPPAIPKMPLGTPTDKPLDQSLPEAGNFILKPSINLPLKPLANLAISSGSSLEPVSQPTQPKMPLAIPVNQPRDVQLAGVGNRISKPSFNVPSHILTTTSLSPVSKPTIPEMPLAVPADKSIMPLAHATTNSSSGSSLQPVSQPITHKMHLVSPTSGHSRPIEGSSNMPLSPSINSHKKPSTNAGTAFSSSAVPAVQPFATPTDNALIGQPSPHYGSGKVVQPSMLQPFATAGTESASSGRDRKPSNGLPLKPSVHTALPFATSGSSSNASSQKYPFSQWMPSATVFEERVGGNEMLPTHPSRNVTTIVENRPVAVVPAAIASAVVILCASIFVAWYVACRRSAALKGKGAGQTNSPVEQ